MIDDAAFKKAVNFVNSVEKYSQSKLKKKAELLRIYEEVELHNKYEVFEDLIFTAKYIQGLFRIITRNDKNSGVTDLSVIKKDFSANMNKVIVQLKEIISSSQPDFQKYFEENYFELSQRGFTNLNELLYDLNSVKKYTNAEKHS